MGIPDRTVQPLDDDSDVYQTIESDCRKLAMSDMDLWCVFQLGMVAYKEFRLIGGKFPHDQTEA
jgi:hypothetical protein